MRVRRRTIRAFDVVTPTPREALEADVARRKRRYLSVILPCLGLVLFGFFVPAPTPIRVAALILAAPLAPIAVIAAGSGSRPPR